MDKVLTTSGGRAVRMRLVDIAAIVGVSVAFSLLYCDGRIFIIDGGNRVSRTCVI